MKVYPITTDNLANIRPGDHLLWEVWTGVTVRHQVASVEPWRVVAVAQGTSPAHYWEATAARPDLAANMRGIRWEPAA